MTNELPVVAAIPNYKWVIIFADCFHESWRSVTRFGLEAHMLAARCD